MVLSINSNYVISFYNKFRYVDCQATALLLKFVVFLSPGQTHST